MRPPLARILACALLALVAVPASAAADALPVPAAPDLMANAHAIAVAHWGMEPCGGQVAVSWEHMGADVNARSRWFSTNAADPSTFNGCSITYNLDVEWDWPKLCTVVEHELGHLSGHQHVDDAADVMSPYYIQPSAECAPATPAATAPPRKPDPAPKSTRKRKASKRTARARARRASGRARSAHSLAAQSAFVCLLPAA
jgi:hypothetical protein